MYLDERTLKIHNLTEALADVIAEPGPNLGLALTAADLQPTSSAALLAAEAAVSVLLAHELGQTVARETEKVLKLPVVAAPALNGNGHANGKSGYGRNYKSGKKSPKTAILTKTASAESFACTICKAPTLFMSQHALKIHVARIHPGHKAEAAKVE